MGKANVGVLGVADNALACPLLDDAPEIGRRDSLAPRASLPPFPHSVACLPSVPSFLPTLLLCLRHHSGKHALPATKNPKRIQQIEGQACLSPGVGEGLTNGNTMQGLQASYRAGNSDGSYHSKTCPLLHTHSKKFARGRCISADLGNTEELNGIRAKMPLLERGTILLFVEAARRACLR